MLIEFSIGNFRSIKDIQTLSFVATPIKDHQETHTFQATDKICLLKSAAIYGANGSGKSNLVKGLKLFNDFIDSSVSDKSKTSPKIVPFRLNKSYQEKPTFFQVIFLVDDKKYRYGFEIKKGVIVSEWLFGVPEKNEVEYFTREEQAIKINKNRFKEAIGLEKKVRKENLFIDVVAEFNGEIAMNILYYLKRNIGVLNNNSSIEENEQLNAISLSFLENDEQKGKLLEILSWADNNTIDLVKADKEAYFKSIFGVENTDELDKFFNTPISAIQNAIEDEASPAHRFIELFKTGTGLDKVALGGLQSKKRVFDDDGNVLDEVLMDFEDEASEGTKKMISWAGLLLKHLEDGGPLFIDEFDARFHPILTKKIVELFNSSANKNAQLFFVTHDTNLLDNALLRRDQIYFAEKNPEGATEIYALSDIKGTRNDASFEKDYIKGKYGAIPYVGDFTKLFS